jgi:molybdate transport system regulatory protein
MERDHETHPVSAPAFDARLHAGDVEFDQRDAALLRTIEESGSLNAATNSLGRSYSRAHTRLSALEEAFGPLVERTRGGSGGGGSRLTGNARALLQRFNRLNAAFSGVASATETVFDGEVVERDGELATVRTPVGVLRVLAPHDATAVQVTVRADTVTLNATGEVPAAGGTSARNRLHGSVLDVDRGESIAQIRLDVGADVPLVALITVDSVERLDLKPETAIVATFKATATRAVPQQSATTSFTSQDV